MKQFAGKIALVVAATRGIGLACAQGLAPVSYTHLDVYKRQAVL